MRGRLCFEACFLLLSPIGVPWFPNLSSLRRWRLQLAIVAGGRLANGYPEDRRDKQAWKPKAGGCQGESLSDWRETRSVLGTFEEGNCRYGACEQLILDFL